MWKGRECRRPGLGQVNGELGIAPGRPTRIPVWIGIWIVKHIERLLLRLLLLRLWWRLRLLGDDGVNDLVKCRVHHLRWHGRRHLCRHRDGRARRHYWRRDRRRRLADWLLLLLLLRWWWWWLIEHREEIVKRVHRGRVDMGRR